jgi:predicted nuclease of predicted toxin-antitoxin system
MGIVLDESAPNSVEEALEELGFETARFETGAPDNGVLDCAVENEVPVITRDQ